MGDKKGGKKNFLVVLVVVVVVVVIVVPPIVMRTVMCALYAVGYTLRCSPGVKVPGCGKA